jgi:hypothetical protein
MTPRGQARPWHLAVGLPLLAVAGIYFTMPRLLGIYARGKADPATLRWLTQTKTGVPGDPINVAIGGSEAQLRCLFARAGWTSAAALGARADARLVKSVALKRPDEDAPVSNLYYAGRKEDVAFEREAGHSASRRHHVRFWSVWSGAGPNAQQWWLGSASFDARSGVNHETLRVTHHIAPDIDRERGFLVGVLRSTGLAEWRGTLIGRGPTAAAKNGSDDVYRTDGKVWLLRLTKACEAGLP